MKKTIIITLITLLTMSSVIVVCVLRWNAWFHNPKEPTYVVACTPHNITISFSQSTQHSRIISWRADTLIQPSSLHLTSTSLDTTICPIPTLYQSPNGPAAFYNATLDSLPFGHYTISCTTADLTADSIPLNIHSTADSLNLILFGDIQDTNSQSSALIQSAIHACPNADALAFIGDLIERPHDQYYQTFFRSLSDNNLHLPLITTAGNHEYLKGLPKHLDTRFNLCFPIPDNGPQRFNHAHTYFLDFPLARIIVLDTNPLYLLSDYTILQTWLQHTLNTTTQPWRIVLMHHSPCPAAIKRSHHALYLALYHTLKSADIVFTGHDHIYYRRLSQPPYVMLNSSRKFYAPKNNLSNRQSTATIYPYLTTFSYLNLTNDSLTLSTFNADNNNLIDQLVLHK